MGDRLIVDNGASSEHDTDGYDYTCSSVGVWMVDGMMLVYLYTYTLPGAYVNV